MHAAGKAVPVRDERADGRRGMTRRRFVSAAAAGAAVCGASFPTIASPAASGDPGKADWAAFKRRFIEPEGRVVDTGNNGVSHSEGQGIGMLAAAHFNDQATFDKLAAWTNAHLTRGTDRLYAWRYKPGLSTPVDDPNNATDGDMLIAWAMFEAARKWNNPIYRAAGWEIANTIRVSLVRPVGSRLVLLPGTYGFVHGERVVVNPSYYVFPALHRFATDMPHPTWARLWKDGVDLLREARYGRWGLPADWVTMTEAAPAPDIADGWPARFSWDAVRVPLYMSWVGLTKEPAVASACDFWSSYPAGNAPAWTDLQSGSVAPYGQSCGLKAVQAFTTASHRGRDATLPSGTDAQDYYAAALALLTRIAHDTRESFSTPIV